MKCFYLPGAPLNLTHDKALTDNVLMMRPADGCAAIQELGMGGGGRVVGGWLFVNQRHQEVWWSIDLIDIIAKIIIMVAIAIVCHPFCCGGSSLCSSTRACFPSSLPILPSCVLWRTDVSFSSLHLSFSLSLSSSVSSFISPNRWFSPVSALLSVLSLSRSHYKRWSPIELINPEWTPFNRWQMSLRRGLLPHWQLLLRRNILMAPLPN